MDTISRIEVSPSVSSVSPEDGTVVLLDGETKTYYTLNETAARIWTLLNNASSLEDMTSAISAEYTISPSRAEVQIDRFLKELENEGLITY